MNEHEETYLTHLARDIDRQFSEYIFKKIEEIPQNLRDENAAIYFYVEMTVRIFHTTRKYLQMMGEISEQQSIEFLMNSCLQELEEDDE